MYAVQGQLHGHFSRKFSEIAAVILISLVALGAGNFPCCKPDEGNSVFFRSAWSHILAQNYSVIAFRVFALDAIMSVCGHVASRLSTLRCNQTVEWPGLHKNGCDGGLDFRDEGGAAYSGFSFRSRPL